ncbi:pescadillo homolog [Coccinella septempunctata]|uniref:pescadillo homolog n=1 Tax=Coccinella septempunctata TaxID=41139 RepID=UPI001D08D5D8|nr:pescadillo homolog [Coccinella septempunctata]
MVSKKVKKYSTGEASKYITRRAALRKLQVSLREFRRLCILKGIYPREPRNRKKAQKGDTGVKTLYSLKDIQFLLHEPIVWKLRDIKTNSRKIAKARALKDYEKIHKFNNNYPTLKLDHIVKERYPTFIDALRDLDDCLTLCFLFSTFPSMPHIPRDQSQLCQRLTTEFMHYVIEAKALRKVFVSIKGYYFQAEIKGQKVTWIVPHHFSFEPQNRTDVDFKLMSIFVEFYTVMLGFVNFRLYHTLNLHYPPKFPSVAPNNVEKQLVDEDVFVAERIAALNCSIAKISSEVVEEEVEIDDFSNEDDPEKMMEIKKEAESLKNLKTLFKGLKIFVNREVPREPLVFMIRCFGGEVSWDKLLFVGATFDENDESITHQIVDRPSMDKQYISRYYVQPQWVFDSINRRQLMPVNQYFMGETLPPHLSPFTNEGYTDVYIPQEERALNDPSLWEKLHNKDNQEVESSSEEEEEEIVNKDESNVDDKAESETEDQQEGSAPKKRKLSVTPGQLYKEDPLKQSREARQEYRLREKMVKNKHKRLYKSMMEGKRKRKKEIWLLRKKRRLHEEATAAEKKATKKNKSVSN